MPGYSIATGIQKLFFIDDLVKNLILLILKELLTIFQEMQFNLPGNRLNFPGNFISISNARLMLIQVQYCIESYRKTMIPLC